MSCGTGGTPLEWQAAHGHSMAMEATLPVFQDAQPQRDSGTGDADSVAQRDVVFGTAHPIQAFEKVTTASAAHADEAMPRTAVQPKKESAKPPTAGSLKRPATSWKQLLKYKRKLSRGESGVLSIDRPPDPGG